MLALMLGAHLGAGSQEEYVTRRTLFVFAHADEAFAFARAGIAHVVTGIGKINAAAQLSRALLDGEGGSYDRVVVFGTAGAISSDAQLDTVYQITAVEQHDFSLPSPRIELSGEQLAPQAIIATGDVFVQDDEQRARIAATGATLVDMETYAFARVCELFAVPLQVFKVPSDFADSSTTLDEWDGIVRAKSEQLLEFARKVRIA